MAAALVYSLTIAPSYQASTRLFVSTTSDGNNTQSNDGGLFAQRRVLSYVELLTGDVVAQRTVDTLGLDMSASDLKRKIEATAPTDTVLIDVTVTDTSATRARDIANTVSDEFAIMAAGLETPQLGAQPNARVIVQQRADVPGLSAIPTARNAALGAVLGVILGGVLALIRGRSDRSVRSAKDTEKATGVGVLAEVPSDPRLRENPLLSFESDHSAAADAFRDLRVNVRFLEVTAGPRVLVVASAMPEEGRTTAAINLAFALAEAGNSVALVDGDLRRPKVARYLALEGQAGLSTVLRGDASVPEALQKTLSPRLKVLTAGAIPPGPTELLESPATTEVLSALGAEFDYVVVDTPSLLKPDAAILAASSQGILLVARYGQTTRDELAEAVRSVKRGGAPLLGTVLMMTPPKKPPKRHGYYGDLNGTYSDPERRTGPLGTVRSGTDHRLFMDEDDVRPSGRRATFVASRPRSAGAESDPPTHRINSATTFLPAPTRFSDFTEVEYKAGERALAAIIFAAIGLVIIPEVINYLLVKHVPDQSIDRALISAETPIAGLARWALSGVLLAVSSFVILMRGHPNRDVTWLLVFLMALNLPYLIGPDRPGPADLIKIMLANLVLLAIWHTGAPVVALKWIPILVSGVGAYSLIGGLIIPEYMMYNIVSRKSLVFGWELAGPFGQSNALGMYCAVAFSLVPLIGQNRWRVVCASILLATIVASASRTALVAVAVVVLWWLICRLRSVISIRLAGTALAGTALAAAMVIPLLRWSPGSFTERAFIWAGGLELWRDAPVVGSGYNWFLQHGQEQAEVVLWAGMGTGHNIHIDTLIKFGLAGLAFLLPIWIGAIYVTGTMRVINEQIALFGYLIAFFVLGMTEAVWHMWPNIQQFPTSALIFATVLMARNRGRVSGDAN